MNEIRNDIERLDTWSNGVLDELEAGHLDEAGRLCEKLLKHYPEMIDGHERMAMVREAQGRWPDAVASYDRALAVIDRNPDAYDGEMAAFLKESRDRAHQNAGGAS